MARLLTVAEFGVLSALYAIIYVFSGFSESIQVIITKYSASEKNKGKLKNILKRSLRKSFFISLILFVLFLFVAIIISYLTQIDYFLIALTGVIMLVIFLVPISRGILQGRKKFKSLGFNMISESLIKLILAIIFVWLGWKVYGAVFGLILGTFIPFLIGFFPLREVTNSKKEKVKVCITCEKENKNTKIFADTVIIAAGYKSNQNLTRKLNGKINELYKIGDCVEVRTALEAIHEGFEVSLKI